MFRLQLSALAAATCLLTQPAFAQGPRPMPAPAQTKQPKGIPLTVVERKAFCQRLQRSFTEYGRKTGYTQVESAMLGSAASMAVVQEFRAGRATDYASAQALEKIAGVSAKVPEDSYLPLATFIGGALGLSGTVSLALSAGELRFIPHAQKGMAIVVIASNSAALTPERAKKVAEIARNAKITVSVVWVGRTETEPGAVLEAQSLAWIAAMTGGVFANLSGADNPCALAPL